MYNHLIQRKYTWTFQSIKQILESNWSDPQNWTGDYTALNRQTQSVSVKTKLRGSLELKIIFLSQIMSLHWILVKGFSVEIWTLGVISSANKVISICINFPFTIGIELDLPFYPQSNNPFSKKLAIMETNKYCTFFIIKPICM